MYLIPVIIFLAWIGLAVYELWFHKDLRGRSNMDYTLDNVSDPHPDSNRLATNAALLAYALFSIDELFLDWYRGDRPPPWRNDFLWEDLDEIEEDN